MKRTVELIKLTSKNIPNKEVIAIGYQNEALVGWISEENGDFTCESEGVVLEEVTYFIKIPKI